MAAHRRIVVSTQTLEKTIPIMLPIDETFDIGKRSGTSIDDRDYQAPFAFTGKIDRLHIAVDPPKLTTEDLKKLEEAYRIAQDAS